MEAADDGVATPKRNSQKEKKTQYELAARNKI